jgi:hypothetical protein
MLGRFLTTTYYLLPTTYYLLPICPDCPQLILYGYKRAIVDILIDVFDYLQKNSLNYAIFLKFYII